MLNSILLASLSIFAASPFARAASVQDPVEAQAPQQSEAWTRLLGRDARVSYTARTAGAAVQVLARSDLTAPERSAALFAIGAAGAQTERARLESWASEGAMGDRSAAILALGELGGRDTSLLERLARSPQAELAEYALFALLRSGSADGRKSVEQVAANSKSPLAKAAASLVAFVDDRGSSREQRVLRRWLDLRWESARRFGLIDGATWSNKIIDDLLTDQRFLDRVIYGAAAKLKDPFVRDHFLELILQPGPPERVRGAVDVMPTDLDRLVATNLWAPADEKEWTELIQEIDDQRLEVLCANILRQSRVVASLRTYASLLLVRGGNQEGMPLLELEINSDDALARARIAEVLGGTSLKSYVPRLLSLMGDKDAAVRNAALVAELRLGYQPARDKIKERLVLQNDDEHQLLFDSLCRNARDNEVKSLLASEFDHLAKGDQVVAATALAATGRPNERGLVRDTLADVPPSGDLGARMVKALGLAPTPEDIAVMRAAFPREGEFEVNVELALGLIGAHDPSAIPILRAALWQEPWNRSLLAAAIWTSISGVDVLDAELQRPPVTATVRDLRRVGFAIGERGGLERAEILARRSNAADPAVQGALLGALSGRTR